MADRTFEVNITTAVQAPYAIKKAGYAGEHNATAIQINLPADYIGGFTYSLDVTTGAGESYKYPVILGDGDDFLYFELSKPLTDKGALEFQLKITETATGMVVKTRVINLQIIGRDINTYAELADNYVPPVDINGSASGLVIEYADLDAPYAGYPFRVVVQDAFYEFGQYDTAENISVKKGDCPLPSTVFTEGVHRSEAGFINEETGKSITIGVYDGTEGDAPLEFIPCALLHVFATVQTTYLNIFEQLEGDGFVFEPGCYLIGDDSPTAIDKNTIPEFKNYRLIHDSWFVEDIEGEHPQNPLNPQFLGYYFNNAAPNVYYWDGAEYVGVGGLTVNEVAPVNGNITLDTSNIESTLDRWYLTDADRYLLYALKGASTSEYSLTSFVVSGTNNEITGTESAIVAGGYNHITGNYSAVIGGAGNLASATYSATIGGEGLIASADNSAIVGRHGETPVNSRFAVANGTDENNKNIAFYVGRDGVSHFDEMPVVPAGRVINADNQLVDKKYVDENGGCDTSGLVSLDQSTPQTFTDGVPLLSSDRTITTDYQLVDKKYVDAISVSGVTEDGVYTLMGLPNPEPNITLINEVKNGNFSSTNNWTPQSVTISATANTITSTGTGSAASCIIYQLFSSVVGHVYYIRVRARATNSKCTLLQISGKGDAINQLNPIQNQWYNLSAVQTMTTNLFGYLTHGYANAADANGSSSEMQYFECIDLTLAFGAGNEPTLSQVETMLEAEYPNTSWVDGTKIVPAVSYNNGKLMGVLNNSVAMVDVPSLSCNVKTFGAVGDGVTDDTTAIQNAITTGNSVYFPAGTYLCSGIELPSNVKLYGDGIGLSILTLPTTPTCPLISMEGQIGGSYPFIVSNVTICDVTLKHSSTFEGSGDIGTLLYAYNTSRVELNRVEFSTFNHYGIHISYNDANTTMAQGWLINSCVFRDGGSSSVGIFLDAEAEYNIICGCSFHTLNYGVKLLNAANNTINNNHFLGCKAILNTKNAVNCGKTSISGNKINHTSGIGIDVQCTYGGTQYGDIINNNDILLTTGVAINLNGSQAAVISGNRFWGSGASLESVIVSDNVIVSDYNLIINNLILENTIISDVSTGTHNLIINNINSFS